MSFRGHYEDARSNLLQPCLVFLSKHSLLSVRGREDVGFVSDALAAWTKHGMRTQHQAFLDVLMHDFHGLLFDRTNVHDCLPFTHARRDFLDDVCEGTDGHAYYNIVSLFDGVCEVGGFNLKLLA